jgi:hypothetical protein
MLLGFVSILKKPKTRRKKDSKVSGEKDDRNIGFCDSCEEGYCTDGPVDW